MLNCVVLFDVYQWTRMTEKASAIETELRTTTKKQASIHEMVTEHHAEMEVCMWLLLSLFA